MPDDSAVVDLAQHRSERLDTNYRPVPFNLDARERRAARRGLRRARLALSRALEAADGE